MPPSRDDHSPEHNSFSEYNSSDSSDSSGFETDTDSSDESIVELPRQYPREIRTQRQMPGQIPWSALDNETKFFCRKGEMLEVSPHPPLHFLIVYRSI